MTHLDVTQSPADSEATDRDTTPVEETLRALAAALRSFRLYEGSNPMVDRFLGALQQKLGSLWQEVPVLRLDLEEDGMLWEGQRVFPTGEAGPELAFLFYQDGVREITILPGFEEQEVIALVAGDMGPRAEVQTWLTPAPFVSTAIFTVVCLALSSWVFTRKEY